MVTKKTETKKDETNVEHKTREKIIEDQKKSQTRLWNNKMELQKIINFLNKLEGQILKKDLCEKFDIPEKQFSDKVKMALGQQADNYNILKKIDFDTVKTGGGGAKRKNPKYTKGNNFTISKLFLKNLKIDDGQRFKFSFDEENEMITLKFTDNEFVDEN